jgi:MFS family permease
VIERWLAEFDRHLRVHGRRRRRVVEELDAHLREGAAAHGEPEAVRRMGDARAVAESFTPRTADRLFEHRDRLAALLMLAAMAASLPLARTLEQLGRPGPSHAWAWFFALLAPTAAVALVSCLAVLRRRPLGARLALPLFAMVAVTASVVLLDLPPSRAEFRQYQAAEIAQASRPCVNTLSCATVTTANDHASEIRINYSLGALALSGFYLWAVTGWTPRRRDRRRALA